MCGISGIISPLHELNQPLNILKMGVALQHRGPDYLGHYIAPAGNIIFSHRRLSLVGLDGRSTVITIPKRNDPQYQIALVFNGEIYNFKELKNYFATRGYISVSASDFEVIIFAYQEWGEACVEHLEGEFAFVLYDEESAKTFMARDRTGVRPLYYAFINNEFVFASEPKALLKHANELNRLDLETTAEFLLMSFAFAAGSSAETNSFYTNIKQFPPAHSAYLTEGRLSLRRYWSLPFVDDSKLTEARAESLYESLSSSIHKRIPEELPVAIALSGGLDSSIVAAVLASHKTKDQIEAFCVKYEGDSNPDFDYAKIMASHLGIKLSATEISPQVFIEGINRCIVANDGPVDSIRRIGMLANYDTMRSSGYKVALIGEGSDEFTLGYYHSFPGLKLDQAICSSAEALSSAFAGRANYIRDFFSPEIRAELKLEQTIDTVVKTNYLDCSSQEPLKRMQHFYARRFLSYLQDANDRAAMACSVEARVPFVDHNFIKQALQVPSTQQVSSSDEKVLLRAAFAQMLPPEIANRTKSAFPANKNMIAHQLIAQEFKRTIQRSQDRVWKVFDKKRFTGAAQEYEQTVNNLVQQNAGAASLVAWLALSQPVSIRTNQIFSLLTLLRWIDLYKPSF